MEGGIYIYIFVNETRKDIFLLTKWVGGYIFVLTEMGGDILLSMKWERHIFVNEMEGGIYFC